MPEKVIPITKVQIGHVLGKGGSTLKGIQNDTGAKLEIVDDGPAVKITAEEQSQVDAAEEAVKKIVENQENPDYEGPEGARLRKEANELGDKRSKLYDEATAKRNGGDHAGANKLVEEAKQAGEEMQARNREAAAVIAKHNNEDKGKGEEYFDMHGLREEEAMDMLKIRVAALEAKATGTVTDFEVIPGAGHHSAPGAQKLKGATEAYLKEKGIEYEAINAGSFMAKVPGKGEGEPPAKKPKAEGDSAAAGGATAAGAAAAGDHAADTTKDDAKKAKDDSKAPSKSEKKPEKDESKKDDGQKDKSKDDQKEKKDKKDKKDKKEKKEKAKKGCCSVM